MNSKLLPTTNTETKLDHLYQTVLCNDEDTPFAFVLDLLKEVYKLSQTEALFTTLLAHKEGSSIVIIAPLEISELRLEQAFLEIKKARHHLKLAIEPNT